jgi:hypothetical protein
MRKFGFALVANEVAARVFAAPGHDPAIFNSPGGGLSNTIGGGSAWRPALSPANPLGAQQ